MTKVRNLENIKRIVIKVGSSTLTKDGNSLDRRFINNLVRDIALQMDKGYEVILVTSGAVAAGMSKLGIKEKPKTIKEKQGCASIGQAELIYEYRNLFSVQEKMCAQILLISEDIYNPERALNLRNTFFNLIGRGIVPIVNENDSIAINEIRVGDNDTLSSLVSVLTESDMLIMLTDIDGLYDKDPSTNKDAILIDNIYKIDDDIEKLCYSGDSKVGTGGMHTKISAARIAMSRGIHTIIANGRGDNIIGRILEGEVIGTYFFGDGENYSLKEEYKLSGYKGKIYINEHYGDHIHMKDIIKVEGEFKKGEIVEIISNNNRYFGYINVCNNNICEDQGDDAIIYNGNIYKEISNDK